MAIGYIRISSLARMANFLVDTRFHVRLQSWSVDRLSVAITPRTCPRVQ